MAQAHARQWYTGVAGAAPAQEGATVRVSGHGSCNMKMNLNGLPQVAKMERVVEKLLVANRFSC
tara:strand:+ start:186 stop:377 length:192 start_codon:yes stop_codon:yes gene_type:complete